MDTPPRLTTRISWSGQRFRNTAATIPRPTPISMETTMANSASSSVAGMYSARSVQHRPVALLGDPKVPVQQVLQVEQVLHRQRPVQPVLVPEGLHRGRVADRALAEVGGRRVTGHQVGEYERHQRDADAQHQPGAEPLQQEPAQVAVPRPSGAGSRHRGAWPG